MVSVGCLPATRPPLHHLWGLYSGKTAHSRQRRREWAKRRVRRPRTAFSHLTGIFASGTVQAVSAALTKEFAHPHHANTPSLGVSARCDANCIPELPAGDRGTTRCGGDSQPRGTLTIWLGCFPRALSVHTVGALGISRQVADHRCRQGRNRRCRPRNLDRPGNMATPDLRVGNCRPPPVAAPLGHSPGWPPPPTAATPVNRVRNSAFHAARSASLWSAV